jgi:hypothetical protein
MNDNIVTAAIAYLAADDAAPQIRVFPPVSGTPVATPRNVYVDMAIEDARDWRSQPTLDGAGFEYHRHLSSCTDFYDDAQVSTIYYPEVAAALQSFTGALAVFVFDHNIRSAVRAARGQRGVRTPVDGAHVDYTAASGPKRVGEILQQFGRIDLATRRAALINLWRPIVGPVMDVPLALCDARSVAPQELVETRILHYGEDEEDTPRHTGHIYSLLYGAQHRWAYVSAMQPDEMLLLKCYDSSTAGRARFTPHTGFHNPACPPEFTARESIEARTLVIFHDNQE